MLKKIKAWLRPVVVTVQPAHPTFVLATELNKLGARADRLLS